jgi:hypothetical protein
VDWTAATIVFFHATCFDHDALRAFVEQTEFLVAGSVVIMLTVPLQSTLSEWVTLHTGDLKVGDVAALGIGRPFLSARQVAWGTAKYYVYEKISVVIPPHLLESRAASHGGADSLLSADGDDAGPGIWS